MVPPRKEEAERRHWRAFWDEVPGWAKTAIVALGAAAGSSYISASPKDLPAQVQRLEIRQAQTETLLNSELPAIKKQLDRMERLLERRLGSSEAKRIRSEIEG